MMMRYRYYILFLVITMLGWNVFLINRDNRMFDAYDNLTPKEKFCQQQASWHPDCNLE